MSANIFKTYFLVSATLKGLGQIVFQANSWSGILILIGLLIGNWQCAIGGVIGSMLGAATAYLFHFDEENITNGIYGFNPSLSGIALFFFFGINLHSLLFVFIASFITPLFQHFFIKRNFSIFTFPFICVTWISFWIYNYFQIPYTNLDTYIPTFNYNTYFTGLNGFGQIIFQGNVFSGIALFIAIFIGNPFKAVVGLIASIIAAILALVLHHSIQDVLLGLFGFNVILTTVALIEKDLKAILTTIVAVALTLLLNFVLIQFELFNSLGGILTLPFVIGTIVAQKAEKIYTAIFRLL